VLSYPNTQQLFNNWNGSAAQTDTSIGRIEQLTSTFAENMNVNPGTAEAAYDIWLSGDLDAIGAAVPARDTSAAVS
jgi:hypothetical protein